MQIKAISKNTMTKRKIKKNIKNPYQIVNLLKYLGLELGKKSNYNIFTNLNLPQDFLQFLTLKE